MSQKILQYIEIDIDYCSLTYGVAPCQASLISSPPTGTIKCFNTLATCQDRANFTNAPVTLRFSVPTNYLPADIPSIPNIKSITFDPAVISLGQNLGQRATLTASFEDHRHSDTGDGFDKYLADRTYDPYRQGTFWGKFRARQTFLRGRPLRWITGNTEQALGDMETRHYIIDSFSGPDNDGAFKIVAKDILKLADGDRALAPMTSNGFLLADITNSATSATLSPNGIGNAEYPASGYLAIGGSEIVSFTRSGDALTITRAQLNTSASSHSAQDRVQLVLTYTSEGPDDIIADLLQNYAGVDASYIPLAEWHQEITTYLNRLYTAVIAQPTSVNTLVSELIEQAGLSMWWDDREQKIGLLVLRGLIYTNDFFSESNVVANSLKIAEQPDKRLSQVHTYFGQINPLTSLTDKANYRSSSVITDPQAEADYGSAAIKEIFSRWIPALGRTIADRLGTILIGRFKDPPRKFNFATLRNSMREIILANGYQLEAWPLQQDTGENETVNMQVTRLRPTADLIEVESEEVLFTAPQEDLINRKIIIDANIRNINLRTAHDQLFPAPEPGITKVICTINTGVNCGSVSNTLFAFEVGDWPSGIDIIIHSGGRIQGKGGEGRGPVTPSAIINGGPALYLRYPIKLSLLGEIYGGGGGGGFSVPSVGNLYGGGGGSGFDPGKGGGSVGSGIPGDDGTENNGGSGHNASGGGGNPGQPGDPGGGLNPNPGGLAGVAIDGVSNITTGSWDGTTFTPGPLSGTILGAQIN